MIRLNSGKMTRYVDLVAPSEQAARAGEQQINWSTAPVVDSVYAEITPLAGSELQFALGFAATVSHRIRIYWLSNINATMRFRYQPPGSVPARWFDINGITNTDELDRELVCYCTEIPEPG